MQSRLETLASLHQSLEENLTKAPEDHSELRAKYEMSLQQLQTDVEAISVALNESKANNTSTVESLKKQIRDLEQQFQILLILTGNKGDLLVYALPQSLYNFQALVSKNLF